MRLYFAPNEYCSSITPRLLHVCDSCFSCFRSELRICVVFLHSGHRTSIGVSLSPCGRGGEKLAPGSINDQLVLQNNSVWLRNSLASTCVLLLSELVEVLDKLNQGPSTSHSPIVETTDTSGEDTDTSQLRQRVRSKRTFKMKNSNATDEMARLFVTGPKDASTKLSTKRVLQPDVPKGCVFTHPRQFSWLTAFPSDPTFRKGSTPPPWDSWTACPLFRRQASDWRWVGEGSLSF